MRSNNAKGKAASAPNQGDSGFSEIRHGSVVAVNGRGILILGASGSGKSGLALRLMGLGARLVADDRVILSRTDVGLCARAPAPLAGLIEARGIGILRVDPVEEAIVQLAVDLDRAPTARMPQPETITIMGIKVELIFGQTVPNIQNALMFIAQDDRTPIE